MPSGATATGGTGSLLDLVGNTPLVRIRVLTRDLPPAVRVYAKLEGFNPGGSVKDRPALNMIRRGLERGDLRPGKTIIDSTSGNTGIALAMIGAALAYPVELVMPENVSIERKKIIHAYGAKIIFSSGLEGSDGAIRLCREILKKDPEKYFKPDQYFNEANPEAHFLTTGPEIWAQTNGEVTHFVTGLGTGGTIMGTGRALKARNPAVQVIGVEPDDSFHGLEGLKHMESAIVPGIYDPALADEDVRVGTEEAFAYTRRLASEGIFVGISSGANLAGALQVARQASNAVMVVIFCDGGEKYLSERFWDEGRGAGGHEGGQGVRV